MDIVCWQKSYSVGNEQIDNEHKVFVEIIGRIHDAVLKEKSINDIKRLIRELETYAVFHFVSEENIMIDSEFPELEEHKKEHEKLLETLDNKIKKIISHEIDPDTLVYFLVNWFVEHTTNRDLKLVKYLKYNI